MPPFSQENDSPLQPSRRTVLGGLGASLAAAALPAGLLAAPLPAQAPAHAEVERLLQPLLVTSDPALFQFAVTVFERCILGRIQPAEPPMRFPWLIPGGVYVGQWIWDTTFLTDLLAILPGRQEFIRGVYQNYWDFQQRWNKAKPAYAHGMVANFMPPDSGPPGFTGKNWLNFPVYSQAPLLAWGVERVYRRNHDLDLVRQSLAGLEAFHDWYWRERDLEGVGLVTVGSYDGVLQNARYETYDNEVDLDTLKLTPHPGRPAGADNGPWYGDICIPANTSYLIGSEASLIRLAQAAGDHAMAARRGPLVRKGIAAMRQHMWDEAQGCFLAIRRGSLAKVLPATIGGFVPAQASIPSHSQAVRMAQALATGHWNTPVPIPSVDSQAAQYKSSGFWRGDVWPSSVYQTLDGLARYGQRKVVGEMAGRLIDNAIKVGVSEHYDSQTGAPLGVHFLGMSAVLLTMAIEGLSPRHIIRVA